jgi:hypothetical protein
MEPCDDGERMRARLGGHDGARVSVEKAPNLRHRRSQTHLHRSQRRPGCPHDLGLAQPTPERVPDDGVLLGRKRVERGVDTVVVAAQILELVGRGFGRWHEVRGRSVERPSRPRAGPQAIDGAAARDRHHPSDGAPPARIEVCGALPQLEEGLLHDVLGGRPIAEDAGGDGHRPLGVLIEQGTNRPDLAVGDARQELPISLPLESGGRPRRRGGYERSAHDGKVETPSPFARSISSSLAGDERLRGRVTRQSRMSAGPATGAASGGSATRPATSVDLARTVKRQRREIHDVPRQDLPASRSRD